MALQLSQKTHGITVNYWAITDMHYEKMQGKTFIEITPYIDETTRRLDKLNALWDLREQYSFDGYFDYPGCYIKLQEPIYIDVPTLDENHQPMYDENGNPITHQVNTNKWVDAITC